MRFLFVILTLLLTVNLTFGLNVRRIALMEVFTNSGCGNCANSNEILQRFYSKYYGGVISVRYHPNFPDPSDPMYTGAEVEIDNRVAYYNILYTPQVLFNGVSYGAAEEESALWEIMSDKISGGSPVWIDIEQQIVSDSVKVTVKITGYDFLNERDMKLRVALVERNVHFDAPPGSNGETDFPDVFRKMLPDTNGIALPAITEGDVLTYEFSTPAVESWNLENIATVAWIQSDFSKEVLQANTNIQTLTIECNEPEVAELSPNQSYGRTYTVTNYSNKPVSFKFYYSTNNYYDNWQYLVSTADGVAIDSATITLEANSSTEFYELVQTDEHASFLSSFIKIKNINDNFPYHFQFNTANYVNNPDVLLINSTSEESLENVIIPIVRDSLNYAYAVIGEEDAEYWLDALNRTNFKSALLLTGDETPAYSDKEIKVALNILNNGGSVWASGQRILSSRGYYQSSRNFCDNYLDVQFIARTDKAGIEGLENNPVSQGLSFILDGEYIPQPEIVEPKNGNANPLFVLSADNSKKTGLYNEGENFKTVYTGFGIEEISDVKILTELMRRVFAWFEVYPDEVETREIPIRFVLFQNYPNPFNPTTTITYVIARRSIATTKQSVVSSANADNTVDCRVNSNKLEFTCNDSKINVSLKIYDALGREIATLVNQRQSPGNYSVQFDASKLSSGIYFYTLRAGNFTATKKMVLMK